MCDYIYICMPRIYMLNSVNEYMLIYIYVNIYI